MQILKSVKSKLNARVVFPCAAALIALVLILLVCIFAGNATNMRNEYTRTRNSFGEDLYRNLRMFVRSYDGVTLAGADVEGSILPSMRDYYLAATTLDDAIATAYGRDYQVLDNTTRDAIAGAFEAFDNAFAQGRSTSEAISSMSACVQSVEQLLNTRYDAETRLIPL
ncbi:MAG TPA: hypothetical protein IAA75_03840 [Candidatus Pullichristensenella avicola]|nr:hypothetical protein [Candidatus Pullichristensenella avicola]